MFRMIIRKRGNNKKDNTEETSSNGENELDEGEVFLPVMDPTLSDVSKILFLPCYIVWQILLAASACVAALVRFSEICFEWDADETLSHYFDYRWVTTLSVILDLSYIVDAALSLLYRFSGYKLNHYYRTRSYPILLMDLLTSVPTLTLRKTFRASGPVGSYYCTANVLVRPYKLITVFQQLWYDMTFFENIFFLFSTMYVMLLLTVSCCFYKFIWAPHDLAYTFTAYLPYYDYGLFQEVWPLKSQLDRFLVSAYITIQTFCRKAVHFFSPRTTVENAVVLVIIVLEGILVNALSSILVLVSTEKHRPHCNFYSRYVSEIDRGVEQGVIDRRLAAKVWKYVHTLWSERRGVTYSRMLCTLIPPGLYLDIKLDGYWEALMHSRLLRDMDRQFLGAVATRMTTEFHSAGDLLYGAIRLKNKMIYVKKGVLEMLSPEDNNTILFSFGEGTCFGDVSLVIMFPNVVILRCATYCEIQTLKKSEINCLYNEFPDQFKLMAVRVATIFDSGRKTLHLNRKTKSSKESFMNCSVPDPTIWTAQVLHRIWSLSTVADLANVNFTLDALNENETIPGKNGRVVTNFLNLVPVKFEHYKTNAIFVTKECPIMLYPDSPLTHFSEVLVCWAVLLLCVIGPYKAAVSVPTEDDILTMLIQIIFILDVVLQSVTTVRTRGILITDVFSILDWRIWDTRFISSTVSMIPFYYLARSYEDRGGPYFTIFRCYQMINLWRVKDLYVRYQETFLIGQTLVRCISAFVIFAYSSYFGGIIFLMSSCFGRKCHPDGWWAKSYDDISRYSNYQVTLRACSQGIMIMTGIPLYNTKPQRMIEHITLTCLSLIGFIVSLTCFASLASAIIIEDEAKFQFLSSALAIKYVLGKREVGKRLHSRAFNYLHCLWDYSKGFGVLMNKIHENDLDIDLNAEVKFAYWTELASRVNILKYFGGNFIAELLISAQYIYLPPGEIVVYRGERVESLVLIDKGYCEVLSDDGSCNLKTHGYNFCLAEALLNFPCQETVRTITSCTLIRIPINKIFKALTRYPYDYREVMTALRRIEFMKDLPVIEETAKEAAVDVIEQKHEYPSFCLASDVEMFAHSKRTNNEHKIKFYTYFRLLKYLLLRIIIIQTGKLFKFLEIFRCLMSILSAFLFPARFILELSFERIDLLLWFLDMTAFIDIYARLHVGYYVEGVLVKCPLKTALKYIKGSMVIDLLSCFPFQLLFHNYFIGNYFRILQIYRVFSLLNTLKSDIIKRRAYIIYIRYLLVILLLINFILNGVIVTSCRKDIEGHSYGNVKTGLGLSCQFSNWKELGYDSPVPIDSLLFILAYWITSGVTQTRQTVLVLEWLQTNPFFIACIITTIVLRLYIMAGISAVRPVETIKVHRYQTELRKMTVFLEKFKANETLRKQFIHHYVLYWWNQLGMNYSNILLPFQFGLKEDILLKIYGETLSKYSVFDVANVGFHRSLLRIAQVSFIVKHAFAVKSKDINNIIFLIHKGYATVCDSEGRQTDVLGRGDFFGKVDENEIFQCHYIKAESDMEVLIFDKDEFHELLNVYPRVKQMFGFTLFYNRNKVYDKAQALVEVITQSETEYIEKMKNQIAIWELVKIVFAVMIYLLTLYQIGTQDTRKNLLIPLYILECLTVVIVIFYYSPWHKGFGEDNVATNFLRHMRGKREMMVDVAALLPVELVSFLGTGFQLNPFVFLLLKLNRTLWLLSIWWCFKRNAYTLDAPRATIRFIFVLLMSGMLVHSSACLMTLCLLLTNEETNTADVSTKASLLIYVQAVSKVLCCMSRYSLGTAIPPKGRVMQILNILMMIFMKLIASIIAREFITFFELLCFDLLEYKREYGRMRILNSIEGNSTVMSDVLDNYARRMYRDARGEHMPQMVAEAPKYLYEPLMESVFGYHLNNCEIFSGCDPDMIRQLSTELQLFTYYPGNIIVRAGLADSSMYFIHAGVVETVVGVSYKGHMELTEKAEKVTGFLGKDECFGIKQGLYPVIKHKSNYRARTKVVILRLVHQNWKHFLDLFPLAKIRIYSRFDDLSS